MIILCIKDHSSNHFTFLYFDVVPLSSSHFIQLIWVKQRPPGLIHKLQIIGVVKDGIAPFLEPTNGKGEKGKLLVSLQSGQLPGIVTRAVHASLQAKENAQNKWVWTRVSLVFQNCEWYDNNFSVLLVSSRSSWTKEVSYVKTNKMTNSGMPDMDTSWKKKNERPKCKSHAPTCSVPLLAGFFPIVCGCLWVPV